MENSFQRCNLIDNVSVMEVYDSAALIGKDFEYIIEQYGVDAVGELMPKVINILEQLECYATRHESENEEITGLEAIIKRLNCDKVARHKERQRYELELEQTEDYWKKETEELKGHVARLEELNKGLMERISDTSNRQLDILESPEEDLIQALRERVGSQQSQIKTLQKESQHKITENENLLTKVHMLESELESIRRTSIHIKIQSQQLLSEQLMLKAALDDKNNQIKQLIGMQEKEHLVAVDDADCQAAAPYVDPDSKPRFTLQELKDVLIERNTAKSKLMEMEEELNFYKSKYAPTKTCSKSLENEKNVVLDRSDDDDDSYVGPVQGPINQEPWDKINQRGDNPQSGIRRLLRMLGVGKTRQNELI